jgi:hypothetical protein
VCSRSSGVPDRDLFEERGTKLKREEFVNYLQLVCFARYFRHLSSEELAVAVLVRK